MTQAPLHALYYPFHLCHERTLMRLLDDYASVHFRDYMAIQLTRMSGTTAYADRMGDQHPDLVKNGRIVQGHSVSGPFSADMKTLIDRDLSDVTWRGRFHEALVDDRRFQRGLFELTHGMWIGDTLVPGPAAWLRLIDERRRGLAYSVDGLQELVRRRLTADEAYEYEYAYALVKTSAALRYTVLLATTYDLEAITDSKPHFDLLERTKSRERLTLRHRWIARDDY